MDGNDISTVAVKGTRDVERFTADFSHKQRFWIGSIVWILLYDVAGGHDMLDVRMRDFSQAHTLLERAR